MSVASAAALRGIRRSGKPGTTSGTRSTSSGGLSQRSRASTRALAAAAMRWARESDAYLAAGMLGVRPGGEGKVSKVVLGV